MKALKIRQKGERLLIDPYQNFHANPGERAPVSAIRVNNLISRLSETILASVRV